MALNFPNASRSYDAKRNLVLFWGYDSTREISFLVAGETLRKSDSHTAAAEEEILVAFDNALDKIHEVARTVYAGARRDAYLLPAEAF